MFDAFVITLRETAELMLIVGTLCSLLKRSDRAALVPLVVAAALAGIAAGALLTSLLASSFVDPKVEAVLTIAVALSVAIMAAELATSAQIIRRRVDSVIERWTASAYAPAAAFLFAFIVAAREALEVGLFLRAADTRPGTSDVLTGFILGVVAAIMLAALWMGIRMRSGLQAAFRLSALLLLLLSIQLLLEAIGNSLALYAGQEHGRAWMLDMAQLLTSGRWHTLICVALMTPPVVHIVKRWWNESEKTVASR